jgi:hypothetical protein
VQLVSQHCETDWKAMLRIFPPAYQLVSQPIIRCTNYFNFTSTALAACCVILSRCFQAFYSVTLKSMTLLMYSHTSLHGIMYVKPTHFDWFYQIWRAKACLAEKSPYIEVCVIRLRVAL